jgi:hypothetical protein
MGFLFSPMYGEDSGLIILFLVGMIPSPYFGAIALITLYVWRLFTTALV